MMFPLVSVIALAFTVSKSSATSIAATSTLGRKLLQASGAERDLEDNGWYFLNQYSIKFQGCHHVQQWNNNADEENDVKIMTKRLARFRLCPSDDCSDDKSTGCRSKYGDYIVDMDTFVQAYLEASQQDREEVCQNAEQNCNDACGDNGNDDCMANCYDNYGAYDCDNEEGQEKFQVDDYAQCGQVDFQNNYNGNNRQLNDDVGYYIGAYCADQGGEVRLGVFSDDTCTTFVNQGEDLFANNMGYELPYSQSSIISTRCMSCSQNDGNGNYETKEMCANIYDVSGKCETRMTIDYPNESSCNYIEGVKIIRYDGVIRTSSKRKSKAAAVAIGLFTTVSVLLAGYVYYLRTKLARAQINLAAASQSLTS